MKRRRAIRSAWRVPAAAVPGLLAIACHGPREPGGELCTGATCLTVDATGRADLRHAGGDFIVEQGVGVAVLADGTTLRTDDAFPRIEAFDTDSPLGEGQGLRVRRGDLTWEIVAWPEGAWTFQLHVDNTGTEPIAVARASALRTERLALGPDPATHRIVENGAFTALDFHPAILPGDVPARDGYALLAPGTWEGHSVSNASHAVVDLESDAAWVAGALSFETTFPALELSYQPTLGGRDDAFTLLSLSANFLPEPKIVAPGDRVSTEVYWVRPQAAGVHEGLEAWADAVAAWQGIVPWHRRVSGRRVPNGWNSWGGGGGTGGYGTDIDEDLLLANAAFMARELLPFGMEWFQIDDGYEPAYGDWEDWRADRFPHGPAWLAGEIRGLGLRPGLWMAPFTAAPDSALVADHPEWFADKTELGKLIVGDTEILDLTRPEVQAHLKDLAAQVRAWGFDWYKLDFGYQALFGTGFAQPLTREQAWNRALEAVREGLGDEAFFLLVGTTTMNAGRVDAVRLGLDSEPVWDWDPKLDIGDVLDQQGLKPMMRTAARRWYLQDRVFVSHPDLIFFRSNTVDASWPRLSLEESRALASFVGLSGGIVKLGDRLLDLQPDQVDVVRRLLPIEGHAARPLDLLEREFPERFELRIDRGLDGLHGPWHLLGLFNWGTNRDLTTDPPTDLPEGDQTMMVELPPGEWVAWELWTESYLGRVSGELSIDVPARDCRVVVLRPAGGRPSFLGWNRQISQGGTLIHAESWDGETLTLRFVAAAGTAWAPFRYHLVVHAPEPFVLDEVQGAEGEQSGERVDLWLEPDQTGEVAVQLRFR